MEEKTHWLAAEVYLSFNRLFKEEIEENNSKDTLIV